MTEPTDDLDDLWAAPPPTPLPKSRQPWVGYDHPQVQLARVQEAVEHLRQAETTTATRVTTLANLYRALDTRLTLSERDTHKTAESAAKLEPIVQEYQRRKNRQGLVKDILNWATVPAMLYLAFSGRVQWADALRALGKILGAG